MVRNRLIFRFPSSLYIPSIHSVKSSSNDGSPSNSSFRYTCHSHRRCLRGSKGHTRPRSVHWNFCRFGPQVSRYPFCNATVRLCRDFMKGSWAISSSVGDLRFRLPKAIRPYAGNYNATQYGLACPQQVLSANTASGVIKSMQEIVPESEDCKSKQHNLSQGLH